MTVRCGVAVAYIYIGVWANLESEYMGESEVWYGWYVYMMRYGRT